MLISCENLFVSYSSKIILSNISFDVDFGDYFLIVGENGSGKTTLIKTLLNINKNYSGNIYIDEKVKQHGIGYLSQQLNFIDNFPASVFEIVLSGNVSKNLFTTKNDKNKALDILSKLNILDLRNKPFKSLSGGQKQRVLIARAIMSSAKLLILDEPFNALDPIITRDLYKLLHKVNKDLNITIIMISHSVKDAILYVNKVMQLNKSVVFFGDKDDYLSSKYYKHLVEGEFN